MAYLVFANFCLWIYYTFEVPKSELSQIEQHFYGLHTWVYLQRIILPCCIFFRFYNILNNEHIALLQSGLELETKVE